MALACVFLCNFRSRIAWSPWPWIKTMKWLCRPWNFSLSFPSESFCLFFKPSSIFCCSSSSNPPSLSSDLLMMYWHLRTTNGSLGLFILHSALSRPLQGSWSSQGIYMWIAWSKPKTNKQNIWVFTECDQHTCNDGPRKVNRLCCDFVGGFQSSQYWGLFFCHPRWNEWWRDM